MIGKIKFILTLVLIAMPEVLSAYTISGVVYEKGSREPLPYCNVFIKGTEEGVFTGDNGYFVLRTDSLGKYEIVVQRLGYKKETIIIQISDNISGLEIPLVKQSLYMKKSVIRGKRLKDIYDPNFSNVRVVSSQMRIMPDFIEPDLFNVIAMLPGAVRRNDVSSALYVRGGKPDQNLILLDGAVLFSPYHLGGIFGTFNMDAIKSVNFMPGGFPAYYGGRLSSVLDISTKEGRKDSFGGSYDIGLLSSKLFVEGPIFRKGSVFLSYRRTYFDIVADAIRNSYNYFVDSMNKSDFVFPYYFHDFNGKTTYYIDNMTKVSLSGLYGEDVIHFDLPDDSDSTGQKTNKVRFTWNNRMVSGNVLKLLNPLNSLNLQVTYSAYLNIFNAADIFEINNQIHNFSVNFKYESEQFVNNKITLQGEFNRTKFMYNNVISIEEDTISGFDYNERVFYSAVSVSDIYRLKNKFVINPGLRLNYFSEGKRFFLSPRLNMKYVLNKYLSLNAAYGYYSQYITTLKYNENIFSQFFGDLWFPVRKKYKIPKSMIYIIGAEYWLNDEYPVSMQIYTKRFYNILSYSGNSYNLDSLISENGLSSGVELLIRKEEGKVTGWIGYTLGITEMRGKDGWYYPDNDQRHNIQIVGKFHFSKSFDMSVHLSFATGMPYTGPAGMYPDYASMYDPINDNYYSDSIYGGGISIANGKYNSLRFEPYKRVDIGFSKKFVLFKMDSRISFNVINVFNFRNPIFYYYDTFSNPPIRHSFYLPIFPSISFRGTF
ncbi:TonB-dependent receptor [candidate division WOR-3 bacterium]|nr:TonB-dependent receptor [candidate division WOR-3 bacterium]